LKVQCVVLGFALLMPLVLFARDSTDIIVMKNGDRLTGEIKGLDAGVLYVSMSYILGTSSIDWSKVARLESQQLFIVKTQDGSVYKGTLKTAEAEADRPVKIEVVEAAGQEAGIDRVQIVEIAQTSDKFWQRFNGQVNLGTTYSKGNETVQYTLGSAAEYLRPRWSAGVTWSSNLSSSSGVTASTRNEITATGRHLLPWNNYFYAGLADFLQSSVQGIRLQTSVGGGIGRYLKNTNRATITILGGFAWQNTRYNQSLVFAGTQNLAAALVAGEAKLFKFNKTDLDVTAVLFPVLSDPGRIKFNMNAAYYIKITGDLSWNVSFYGNWDNQPPPHFTGNDYGTSSGLSWTFGMK
jgi:small nuclear ribonucleoprotein (snRNP)-like protein